MTRRAARCYLVPNDARLRQRRRSAPTCGERAAARRASAPRRGSTHWVAENAKTTRAFLKRVDAVVPLAQPLQAARDRRVAAAAEGRARARAPPTSAPLLAPALAGHDLGLISEAGLPAVADPGAALVAGGARRRACASSPLPGASSLLLALAASGLNGQSFAFVGYLPVDAAARAARIRELEALSRRAGADAADDRDAVSQRGAARRAAGAPAAGDAPVGQLSA